MTRSIARLAAAAVALMTLPTHAAIGDFTTWTLLEDPAHASFAASATAGQATLTANGGPIGSGTDIGYAAANDAGTTGHVFSPNMSFALAIDYAVTFTDPVGSLGIGFGIGEDNAGNRSAGVGLLFINGSPAGYAAAARDGSGGGDIIAPFYPIGTGTTPDSATGSFYVAYDAATKHVTVDASTNPNHDFLGSPVTPYTFDTTAVGWAWERTPLAPAFFLRSEDPSPFGDPWQDGQATAVFSNLRVLSGVAIAVPEPTTAALLVGGLALLAAGRRTRSV